MVKEVPYGSRRRRRKGWGFRPTDEEIIDYVINKNEGLLSDVEEIPDVDICDYDPWDLPRIYLRKSSMETNDTQCFFFSPSKRKYKRGDRKDRTTRNGYWKATGEFRNTKSQSPKLIGKKRTLVFYKGHAPEGKKTDWVIHEYQKNEGDYVLCRLKRKSEGDLSPKSDDMEQNGVIPATTIPYPDILQVLDVAQDFGIPSSQGIVGLSDAQTKMHSLIETENGILNPYEPEEVQPAALMANCVDGSVAEVIVTEVATLSKPVETFDHSQCMSPLNLAEFVSPLNEKMYTLLDENSDVVCEEPIQPISSACKTQNEQTDFGLCMDWMKSLTNEPQQEPSGFEQALEWTEYLKSGEINQSYYRNDDCSSPSAGHPFFLEPFQVDSDMNEDAYIWALKGPRDQ